MKRLFLIIISAIFLLPTFFTKEYIFNIEIKENIINKENKTEDKIGKEDDDNKDTENKNSIKKIKLLHKSNNKIEDIDLEEYLLGVVSAEMPASYNIEALKAQAVVARTYVMYNNENNITKHNDADICDDSKCCQAWISKEDRFNKWEESSRESNWNKIKEAVYSTKGKIVTFDGKAINAFFHSNSGGKTDNVSNVWGGKDLPYLQSIETAGESVYNQYESEVNLTKVDFENKIKNKYKDFIINYDDKDCIKVIEYTSGNRVKTIKVGNLELSGVEVRTIIGLKSANFEVEINGDNIKFKVKGYGHGVGMSQTGADSLAKEGKNYEEIIKHFYKGVEIKDI